MDAQESALESFVETLEAHLSNATAQGRFTEAEVARRRLAEVHAHAGARRREALRSRQLAEGLGLKQAYLEEFGAFNACWDGRTVAFDEGAGASLTGARARHACALRDFQQRLLAKGAAPRHSKAYRDLRHVQETLARANLFEAAGAAKAKADALLAVEEEAWYATRHTENLRKEQLFRDRLELEVGTLKRRAGNARAELARGRAMALERLMQRYANVQAQLEREHRGQAVALDKALALEELARRAEASNRATAARRGAGAAAR